MSQGSEFRLQAALRGNRLKAELQTKTKKPTGLPVGFCHLKVCSVATATATAAVAVFVTVVVVMALLIVAATATAATTTTAATALLEVFRLGQTTEFDGLGDVILDRVAQAVQFFLRIEEALGDRIGEQRIAARFKIGDLLAAQGEGLMLLLVQRAAFVHDRIVLRTGIFIAHEGVNFPTQREHRRLGEDGVAQVLGLLQDNRVLSDG